MFRPYTHYTTFFADAQSKATFFRKNFANSLSAARLGGRMYTRQRPKLRLCPVVIGIPIVVTGVLFALYAAEMQFVFIFVE